jgi:diguanylate cyclase (GGDEF)-like protein/PAS domain S-box-containing protein
MRKLQVGNYKVPWRHWPGLPAGEDPFRQFVDSVREYAIYLMDRNGYIRSWNAGAERINGYRAADIVGQPFTVLYTRGEIEQGRPQELLRSAAERGRVESEGWRVRRDGTRFWADAVLTALHEQDGEVYGYAVITRDLTEKRQRDEELRRSQDRSSRLWTAAISDALTGAFNRRYMMNHLRGAVDRGDHPVSSMLLFDVDHFKAINDQNGHDAGDQVLKRIAAVARQISRDSDMLFRLGGDEFVLYLPGVATAGASVIAQRLLQAVVTSNPQGGRQVTVSIGVAERRPGDSVETWVRNADAALYQAKQHGRNRVAC